jgi:hypothetical protein
MTFVGMAKVHIGKKIKEVWTASRLKGTEFATLINKDRQVIYDIFKRETIDTGLLETISKVLNHDFFNYYEQNPSSTTKESKSEYGYATKDEVANLAHAILKLTKAVERIEEQLPKKKAVVKKVSKKK